MKATIIKWKEPNRERAPPLHIADRGERYPTVTGVSWLSAFEYVVAHRCGLKIGVFDTRLGDKPICIISTAHRVDDIAAKNVGYMEWEIAASGCWDAMFSKYSLILNEEPKLSHIHTEKHTERTFSHGVSYDFYGNLCIALHTGSNPRIDIGGKVSRVPAPWGPRNVCFDRDSSTYYAVCVSANPRLEQYEKTATSVWSLTSNSSNWIKEFSLQGTHSDSCDFSLGRIWLPDQKLDRVIGVNLKNKQDTVILSGKCFDFPHGLSVSPSGILAVTNYGNSSVVLVDLNEVVRIHNESR